MILIKTVIDNLKLNLVMMRGESAEINYSITVKLIESYLEVGEKL